MAAALRRIEGVPALLDPGGEAARGHTDLWQGHRLRTLIRTHAHCCEYADAAD